MHVQQSGFNVTVIVIMQVAVKSVLVKGNLWLIVSHIKAIGFMVQAAQMLAEQSESRWERH